MALIDSFREPGRLGGRNEVAPSGDKTHEIGEYSLMSTRTPHTRQTVPFSSAVLSVVRRIPPGRVATYGDVAGMAGKPRAARAVGNIMRECHTRDVPCHRVVGAGGALGGYGGNTELKKSLLRAEGIVVVGRRIRRFAALRWQAR
jgi:O-6-methylguanine DNA methyltransferase